MSIYRNLLEYAESKGIDASSKYEAKLALLSEYDARPLFSRGNPIVDRRVPRSAHFIDTMRNRGKEWDDVWKKHLHKPGILKQFLRRVRVLEAFEAKAALQSAMLNLPDMEDCDAMALDRADVLCEARANIIEGLCPDLNDVTIYCVPRKASITAMYCRMDATFSMTREALMELPCDPVLKDCVILDAVPVHDGVWFMRWATIEGRKKTFTIISGGYYDNELVIGYENINSVFANYDEIQKLARTRAVTRALKGGKC